MEGLQDKIAELEDGMNKHHFEAGEHKVSRVSVIAECALYQLIARLFQVKELEQKLELERSSARRHESQISRLRHQLERVQGEKTEDASHKSSDALNRSQKQIRELRAELQEAERKEQEMSKRRRNAVSGYEVMLWVRMCDSRRCYSHAV